MNHTLFENHMNHNLRIYNIKIIRSRSTARRICTHTGGRHHRAPAVSSLGPRQAVAEPHPHAILGGDEGGLAHRGAPPLGGAPRALPFLVEHHA
jgi:hypothetical protein